MQFKSLALTLVIISATAIKAIPLEKEDLAGIPTFDESEDSLSKRDSLDPFTSDELDSFFEKQDSTDPFTSDEFDDFFNKRDILEESGFHDLVARAGNGMVELFRENTTDPKNSGSLVYFGVGAPKRTRRSEPVPKELEVRDCKDDVKPTCSKNHGARNADCDSLITDLSGNGNIKVAEEARQICYLGPATKNGYCCVSWRNKIPDLLKSHLADHASEIKKTCDVNGISGKYYNKKVVKTCTDLCLSNRGNKC